MVHRFLMILLIGSFLIGCQDKEEHLREVEAYQAAENESFGNPETSILKPEDLKDFSGLEFYPIDIKYRVKAKFIRTPNEKPFLMRTTTDRLPEYVKYGEVQFKLDGKNLKLELFQDTQHLSQEGYEDYLFLPITDLTSGDGSYGGGRFLDVKIPIEETMVLDFNKLYNPLCAYNERFSCPIPPKQNDLQVRIEAGVKDFGKH